jgi:NADH dehydrogenase
LADLLPAWYEELGGDGQDVRVVLVQRGSDILQNNVKDRVREMVKESLTERRTPVELLLNAAVTDVSADSIRYQQDDEDHTLLANTVVWTAGSATHPIVQSLPIADIHQDDRGRPYLTSALQIVGFPNVFAGGDCAVNVHQPQPASAQVAYQQGRAIAQNILAMIEGHPIEPSNVTLRGTLIKSGIEEGIAEILDKFEVSGRVGHLVRQATYLSLLPTPARNIKLGAEWITDEVFEQFLNA